MQDRPANERDAHEQAPLLINARRIQFFAPEEQVQPANRVEELARQLPKELLPNIIKHLPLKDQIAWARVGSREIRHSVYAQPLHGQPGDQDYVSVGGLMNNLTDLDQQLSRSDVDSLNENQLEELRSTCFERAWLSSILGLSFTAPVAIPVAMTLPPAAVLYSVPIFTCLASTGATIMVDNNLRKKILARGNKERAANAVVRNLTGERRRFDVSRPRDFFLFAPSRHAEVTRDILNVYLEHRDQQGAPERLEMRR